MIPKIQNQKSTNKSNRFCHTSRKIVEAWKIKNVLLNGYDPIVQTLLVKVERYNDSVKSQLIGSFISSFTFFRFFHLFFCFFVFFSDYFTEARSWTGAASDFARTLGMEQCGHMAICDAHARYRDYGIIALPLILLFPG